MGHHTHGDHSDPTPRDLLSHLFDLVRRHQDVKRNLTEVLELHGVTFEALTDLLCDIAVDVDVDGHVGADGARAVCKLHFLHLFEADVIASMADLDPEHVAEVIEQSPRNRAQRLVMRRHLDGCTPQQISDETGIHRQVIYRWLDEAGQKPHRSYSKVTDAQRGTAVAMYRSGAGYARISEVTGLNDSQVSMVLRKAHADGDLPEYGTSWALRKESTSA